MTEPAPAPAQQPPVPPPFLEVPGLLEASQPRPNGAWLLYAVGAFFLVVIGAAILSRQSDSGQHAVKVLSALSMIVLMGLLSLLTVVTVRRHRREQEELEAASELVQLRRWPQAVVVLQQILSRPARSPTFRTQALIYLASVLARYHRFDDAIQVHEYLLEHELVDDTTAHGLRLGRAMAMLREDHLFDADRALNELRRTGAGMDSAGLALVEIYRDVKTGHPAEAVELFDAKLATLRGQLGHRVADAHALVARAYDLLGRAADAQAAYARATLLSPPLELERRYPELEKLRGRYQPAPAPPEAA